MLKRSCENPDVTYLCLPGRRLIFEEGRYIGWYKPRRRGRR